MPMGTKGLPTRRPPERATPNPSRKLGSLGYQYSILLGMRHSPTGFYKDNYLSMVGTQRRQEDCLFGRRRNVWLCNSSST